MSGATSAAPPHSATRARSAANPIRVMIVDDSAVVRGLISRWIAEEPDLTLAASHPNGRKAVEDVARSKPDVTILDIEMPEMDGLTALPLLLDRHPAMAVIMASTLTRRGAEISIRALTLGAMDYVPKPDPNGRILNATDYRQELLAKIRSLGSAGRTKHAAPAKPRPASPGSGSSGAVIAAAKMGGSRQFRLRPASMSAIRVVTIGSSTGGPQALTRFFTNAGPALGSIPVLVTQHMPPTFTTILAEHIGKASGRPAAEGVDGEIVKPGHIYVAPGGKHMTIAKTNGATVIRLGDGPPINFCKPAVDPLFNAVAEVYGSAALGIIFTGMGSDGAKGAVAIADAGGTIIAQDEASSVVWGMPGAAAEIGACTEILPLDDIGPRVVRRIGGGRA